MRLLVSMILALVVGAGAAVASPDPNQYSNQTPYGNAATASIVAPPAGYELFFVEMVARHGARPLTKPDAEKRVLALWEKARKRKALTSTGKHLRADVLAFQSAERRVGYGKLSAVGRTEWAGIGRRFAAVYDDFLTRAQDSGESIRYVTTDVGRTQQSANVERQALRSAGFGALDDRSTASIDTRMVISSGSTTQGRAAIAKVRGSKAAKNAARTLLRRSYSKKFVSSIKDPVAAAHDLYLLFTTAPGMAGDSKVTFASYVPGAVRAPMAQIVDAENFYRFGPGVAGQRSSYAKADPILKDVFAAIDARIAGGTTAAVLRHAHGETTMPFAARIRITGSDKQQPASRPYSYATNPWRGAQAGRLAGNIELALYRQGNAYVATFRYHEKPAKLAGCSLLAGTQWFYSLPELKRCLNP